MANTIELRKQYSTLLDEIYKLASLTAVLDGPNELVREGANANEILIPKMSTQGLANYNKQTGYEAGSVTLDYETKKCTYDRGRMFTIDAVDNIETAGVAFGRLSGEFLRTKVVPELDAYRLSSYASIDGVTTVAAALENGKAALAALRAARSKIENAEANLATCYLFINPSVYGMIEDLDTTASRKAIEGFAGIVKVPEGRFYSKIDLNANGEGGFKKNESGKAINFLIVDKQTAIQFQKHTVSKIITPESGCGCLEIRIPYRWYCRGLR